MYYYYIYTLFIYIVYLLTHSLTHSVTHSFIHSFIYLFLYLFIYLIIYFSRLGVITKYIYAFTRNSNPDPETSDYYLAVFRGNPFFEM